MFAIPHPDDYEQWRLSTVTQAFFRSLTEERAEIAEALAQGRMVESANPGVTYAHWSGKAQGLQMAIDHVPRWAVREEEEKPSG